MLRQYNNSILEMYIINIFHHLKLGIASAIPASNEWKIEANNSAAQELIFSKCNIIFELHYICNELSRFICQTAIFVSTNTFLMGLYWTIFFDYFYWHACMKV